MSLPNTELFAVADSTVLICGSDMLPAPALREAIARWSLRLAQSGVKPGDRVIVFGGKSLAQTTLILSVLRLGAVLVPVYAGLKAAQVTHIVTDSQPVLAVVTESGLNLFSPACASNGVALTTIEALASGPVPTTPPASVHIGAAPADDPAAIIYTSGSTGLPKGVVFSRANLVLGARSVAAYAGFTSRDRVLCLLPFSFDAGFNQLLAALVAGASVVLADFIHAAPLAALCRSQRISILTAVPGLWTRIIDHDWQGAGGSLRLICNTGGHLHPTLSDRLRVIFPLAEVMPMYGFTEAFRCAFHAPTVAAAKPGSVGRAIPYASFAIFDAEGRLCPAGVDGELVQFGPLVTLGYWNKPALNREKFRAVPPAALAALMQASGHPYRCDPSHFGRAAWSGDLMRVDDEGDLYFISRKDAMIKANGFRISPSEIEDACLAEGACAAVATAYNTDRGDVIVVVWQAVPGDDEPAACKIARLKARLPSYMVPSRVELVAEMPVNGNGKFDRAAVTAALSAVTEDFIP